jgi:alanyl-tRNA synthetase
MTDRIYYTDPYCREFDATVLEVDEADGRQSIVLDRTAFYPTSGGQPFDTGAIGGRPVVDVLDKDGVIVHVVERNRAEPAPLAVGESVRGTIDWPRRFDHMQQHTGQHVLSAAFDRLFGARTVSFHLGSDRSTIDLDRELPPDRIAKAEREANRIVWENRPVAIRFGDGSEVQGLRKPSAREGTLRLIDVHEFDLSACGGTHVARTGEVGIIGIKAWERFKGGQRLEFLCGSRALGRWDAMRDTLATAGRLLSAADCDLSTAIERVQGEAKDQRRVATALATELAGYRARDLRASAVPAGAVRLVLRTVDGDVNALKALAAATAAEAGYLVVLTTASTPGLLVVARSKGVNVEANTLLATVIGKLGGRGGGSGDLAQAGGINAGAEAVLEAAREAVGA